MRVSHTITKNKNINVSKKYAENEPILNYSQINEVSSRAAPGSRSTHANASLLTLYAGLGLELGLGLTLAKTFDALAMAAAKAS